eukprot:14868535-Ditylum_brightwellii.AAC.1
MGKNIILSGEEALSYQEGDEEQQSATILFQVGHDINNSQKCTSVAPSSSIFDVPKPDEEEKDNDKEIDEGVKQWETEIERRAGLLNSNSGNSKELPTHHDTTHFNSSSSSLPPSSNNNHQDSSANTSTSLTNLKESITKTLSNLNSTYTNLKSTTVQHRQNELQETREQH